jgi:glycosyltransferase involved in cell wall biosynthesis
VIVEHEAGIFRDVPFARALLSLWRRRHQVVLSMHELEPEKFHHYRVLSSAIHYRMRYPLPLELVRIPWVALRIAWAFLRYRAVLTIMGSVPRRLIVHSARSHQWIGLLSGDASKVDVVPLMSMPMEGIPDASVDKRALRERLGLPRDRFLFISPGFFFARKRLLEVIKALPADASLILSGTRPPWDTRYYDEVVAWLERERPANVILNTDYDRTPQLMLASDAVVLYYRDVFQSAVAAEAMWAGIPCIFSDIEGFRTYRGAGLVVADDAELARAMRDIQRPETVATLRRQVQVARRMFAPERLAARYLIGL